MAGGNLLSQSMGSLISTANVGLAVAAPATVYPPPSGFYPVSLLEANAPQVQTLELFFYRVGSTQSATLLWARDAALGQTKMDMTYKAQDRFRGVMGTAAGNTFAFEWQGFQFNANRWYHLVIRTNDPSTSQWTFYLGEVGRDTSNNLVPGNTFPYGGAGNGGSAFTIGVGGSTTLHQRIPLFHTSQGGAAAGGFEFGLLTRLSAAGALSASFPNGGGAADFRVWGERRTNAQIIDNRSNFVSSESELQLLHNWRLNDNVFATPASVVDVGSHQGHWTHEGPQNEFAVQTYPYDGGPQPITVVVTDTQANGVWDVLLRRDVLRIISITEPPTDITNLSRSVNFGNIEMPPDQRPSSELLAATTTRPITANADIRPTAELLTFFNSLTQDLVDGELWPETELVSFSIKQVPPDVVDTWLASEALTKQISHAPLFVVDTWPDLFSIAPTSTQKHDRPAEQDLFTAAEGILFSVEGTHERTLVDSVAFSELATPGHVRSLSALDALSFDETISATVIVLHDRTLVDQAPDTELLGSTQLRVVALPLDEFTSAEALGVQHLTTFDESVVDKTAKFELLTQSKIDRETLPDLVAESEALSFTKFATFNETLPDTVAKFELLTFTHIQTHTRALLDELAVVENSGSQILGTHFVSKQDTWQDSPDVPRRTVVWLADSTLRLPAEVQTPVEILSAFNITNGSTSDFDLAQGAETLTVQRIAVGSQLDTWARSETLGATVLRVPGPVVQPCPSSETLIVIKITSGSKIDTVAEFEDLSFSINAGAVLHTRFIPADLLVWSDLLGFGVTVGNPGTVFILQATINEEAG